MRKIKISTVNDLRNPEFQQYMKNGLDMFNQREGLDESLQERIGKLQEAFDEMGTDFQVQKKHELTDALDLLDQKRLKTLAGLKKEIESLLFRSEQEIADQGQTLLNNYTFRVGSSYTLTVPQRTAAIEGLIEDLKKNAEMNALVEKFNLQHWFTTLEVTNTEFYTLFVTRLKTKKKLSRVKEQRATIKGLFDELVKDTEALARVAKDKSTYLSILENLAAVDEKYSNILKLRSAERNKTENEAATKVEVTDVEM